MSYLQSQPAPLYCPCCRYVCQNCYSEAGICLTRLLIIATFFYIYHFKYILNKEKNQGGLCIFSSKYVYTSI